MGSGQNYSNSAGMHDESDARAGGISNSQLEANSQVVMAGGNLNNSGTLNVETTTTTGTTTFVNDRTEVHNVIRDTMIDSTMSVAQTDDNTIGLFMAKPYLIDSVNWTSSSAANTVLGGYSVANYLTGSSVPNIWKNKVSGYNLFRGTAVLKVILNAQPFQAGRLLIHFLPQAREFFTYSGTYVALHNLNLTTKTQQPCVEVDIQDGVATLEAPFISPVLWHRRVDGFDWGSFLISVLSPVASAASTTVTFKVYMYFKDFECAAPIYGPEMNAPLAAKQVKERRKVKEAGVVSTFFDAVSKPFDILRGVPLIGPTTGVIADATKKVSEFFGLFGWSRPLDERGVAVFKQHPQYQGFNFNGTNACDVLAMDSMNQVQPMENFAGSGVDEMAFSYLKKIPAYNSSVSWTTSLTEGTSILSVDLYPANLVTTGSNTVGGYNYIYGTGAAFAYLSRYFKYWRGSIIVTIKVVKTQFHAGRLQVAYAPATSDGIPSSLAEEAYVYRDIIDVRESDTYSFTLPYIHSAPFLNTGWNATASEEFSMGRLSIRVLNPLLASTTVSSAVDVLIYYSAGDDFQLAGLQAVSAPAFSPEMNTDAPRIIGPIADAPQPEQSVVPYALCTGEVFTSVKQLYQCLRPLAGTLPGYNTNYRAATIFPYITGLPSRGSAPGIQTSPLGGDYLGELVPGYVYSRGGIRFCVPGVVEGNSIEWLASSSNGSSTFTTVGDLPNPTAANIAGISNTILAPQAVRYGKSSAIDVITPHYGQTHSRLNYVATAQGASTVPVTLDSPDYSLNVITPAVTGAYITTPNDLFRSGADDFCTGYFIGFPPFVISTTEVP